MNKPHRRLSLTQPTTDTSAQAEVVAAASPGAETAALVAPASTVRVMAYLTPNEAHLLDSLWLALRRSNSRASKSDILRAALTLAGDQQEELASVLTKQQVSTLTRQQSSKAAR